jgi:hypothetical protein
MTCFAIVRGPADVSRATQEIGTLLSIAGSRQIGQPVQNLLGLWVHPTMVEKPPVCLVQPSVQKKEGNRQVVQTTSMLGIWTLCWLDSMQSIETGSLSQKEFFDCLLATSGEEAAEGKYIPVCSNETEFSEALNLQNSNANTVLPPLFWDTGKRRLSRIRLVVSRLSPDSDLPAAAPQEV